MSAPQPGPDVNFDFQGALSLARQYHAMAGTISSYQSHRDSLAATALTDWQGVYAGQFTSRMKTSDGTAAELEAAVRSTAGLWAEAWAHAAWQQQRVEWARYCQKLDNQRSELTKIKDWFTGDSTKFPPAPGQPPVPTAPDFAETVNPYVYPPNVCR